MLRKVPLADRKDDLIERWIRNPGPSSPGGGRLHLPDLGKPAAVRRGKAALPVAVSPYRRRVVAVAYFYRMRGAGFAKLHSHLSYIERPGAGEQATSAALFGSGSDEIDGHAAINRGWRHDRHHFRIILAPNDGHRLDMKGYVREYMAELEKALGTKLEWMAGIHEKPDEAHARNRHAHVVVRGIDDKGGDLVLDREFIRHEMRRIAEELASRHLGQMSQRELDAHIARQAERELQGRGNYDMGYRAKGWGGRARGKAGEGLDHG